MKHKKPTSEELDEAIKKSIEEIETPQEEEKQEEPQEPQEEVKEEVKEEEKEEETPEAPPPEEEVDYKKKFVESTREAQILHAKNKKINEAIEAANTLPDPDEAEMQKEFADWDVMSDTEKRLAKDNLLNKRKFQMLDEVTRESKQIDEWNSKVDSFIDNPKTLVDNPELEGKLEEFKVFSTKPTRRGVDMEDLVSSFLYKYEKGKPTPKKGSMILSGSGGPSDKGRPKGDKISMSEAATLQKTDYKKWKELLLAGKIESEL